MLNCIEFIVSCWTTDWTIMLTFSEGLGSGFPNEMPSCFILQMHECKTRRILLSTFKRFSSVNFFLIVIPLRSSVFESSAFSLSSFYLFYFLYSYISFSWFYYSDSWWALSNMTQSCPWKRETRLQIQTVGAALKFPHTAVVLRPKGSESAPDPVHSVRACAPDFLRLACLKSCCHRPDEMEYKRVTAVISPPYRHMFCGGRASLLAFFVTVSSACRQNISCTLSERF